MDKVDRNKNICLSNNLENILFPPGKYTSAQLVSISQQFAGLISLEKFKELMVKNLQMPNQQRIWWVIKAEFGEVNGKILLVVLMLQLFGKQKREHEGFNEASRNIQAHSNSPGNRSNRALYINNQKLLMQNFIKQNIQIFLRLLSSDNVDDPAISVQQLQNLSILFRLQSNRTLASYIPAFNGNQKVKASVIAQQLNPKITISQQYLISLEQLRFSVIIKQQAQCRGKDINIIGCANSQIFIDSSVRSLYVVSCANCTIYVAACQKIAFVDKCQKISLTVTSNLLRIGSTVNSNIYSYCPSPTILTGGNKAICLGPHNSVSKDLRNHMKAANIAINNSFNSQFENVICKLETGVFQIMKPSDFDILVLPSKQNEEKTLKNANTTLLTPQIYIKQLQERNQYYNSLKSNIAKINLSQDSSKQLHSALQGHFKQWLTSKGYNKDLIDLVKMIDKK